MVEHRAFKCLLVIATLLKVCNAGCKLPPVKSEYFQIVLSCHTEVGTDMMCWVDCFARKLGVIDDKGMVNEPRLDELINQMEPGELQDAMWYTKEKCFQSGLKIKLDIPKCGGYLKVAKCARKCFREKCANLAELYGI